MKRRFGFLGWVGALALLAACGQDQATQPAPPRVAERPHAAATPSPTPVASATPVPSVGDYAALFFCNVPGVFRVTGADLQRLNVPIEKINPAEMALIWYQTPVPIYLETAQADKFGPGDSFYFYSMGPRPEPTYFNDMKDYFPHMQRFELFMANKPDAVRRYKVREAIAPAQADALYAKSLTSGSRHDEINQFFEFIHRDEYASQTIHTDFLFWQKLTYPETNKTSSTLNLPVILDATQASHLLKVRLQLAGTANFGGNSSRDAHHIRLDWNGKVLKEHSWHGKPLELLELDLPEADCLEGTNTLSLTVLEPIIASAGARMKLDVVYLDWMELGYTQDAACKPNQNQLLLHDISASSSLRLLRIGNFPSSHTMVFDLDAGDLLKGQAWADAETTGTWAVNVNTSTTTRTLAVLSREQAMPPAYTTATLRTHYFEEKPSDTDFLIITNRQFEKALRPFVEWKRERGLKPKVVCTEDLYYEQGGGYQLPETLRDYIKHVYESAQPARLKYVLLVGDATAISMYHTYLPSYSYVQTGRAANENFFAAFDNPNGVPKVALGRFSVGRDEDIVNITNKVKAYEQRASDGLWRAKFCMIAASYDWARDQSDKLLQQFVHPNYLAQYLYSDPKNSNPAYHEQINQQLKDYMDSGNLMTVFLGHGGGTIWEIGPTLFQGAMTKHLFDQNNVSQLTNTGAPSLVMALTCYTNDFDNPDVGTTLGETFLNSPGGAIGVIGAAQRTSTYSNQQFIQTFMTLLCQRQGERLGDYWLKTKQQLNGSDFSSTYLLLGDPTLEFSMPKSSIRLKNAAFAGDSFNMEFELPGEIKLPAQLDCSLVDAKDNGLLTWRENVTTAQGKIAKVLPDSKITSATTRLVVYCSSGMAGDFTGAMAPATPAAKTAMAATTGTTTTQGK